MNTVILIGRIATEPKLTYTSSEMAICKFKVAVDRPTSKDGKEKEADFPAITVFGRQAENVPRFTGKGKLVGIQGRIHTGSYTDKEGKTVYTTDVTADRVEFLEWADRGEAPKRQEPKKKVEMEEDLLGFQALDADIPF